MKKTYTKKLIQEAIKYWENKLKLIDEASGSMPFVVGNSVVEKMITGLLKTLHDSELVSPSNIDYSYNFDHSKIYISNIGQNRNLPGDILVVFHDFKKDQRCDVRIEVKSSTSSSIFQFTYKPIDIGTEAQQHYLNMYPKSFKEINQNISDFLVIYKFVNGIDYEDLGTAIGSVEQPVYSGNNINSQIDEKGFNDTLKYILSFANEQLDNDENFARLKQFVSFDDYIDEETVKYQISHKIFKLKKLIRNKVGLSFCEPFEVDIDFIKTHYADCDYIRIGKFLYALNDKNPLHFTRKGKAIKTIDDEFTSALMTCYLKKPSLKNPGFRLICKTYNFFNNDGYEISLDDSSFYPDIQKQLVGATFK